MLIQSWPFLLLCLQPVHPAHSQWREGQCHPGVLPDRAGPLVLPGLLHAEYSRSSSLWDQRLCQSWYLSMWLIMLTVFKFYIHCCATAKEHFVVYFMTVTTSKWNEDYCCGSFVPLQAHPQLWCLCWFSSFPWQLQTVPSLSISVASWRGCAEGAGAVEGVQDGCTYVWSNHSGRIIRQCEFQFHTQI